MTPISRPTPGGYYGNDTRTEAEDEEVRVDQDGGPEATAVMPNLHRGETSTNVLASHASRTQFMVLIVATQAVRIFTFGAGVSSGLSVATSIHNHSQHSTQVTPPGDSASIAAQAAWITASYPLTNGTFVLMGGRLGAVYGHRLILALGCAWWVIWHFGCGFATNTVVLCIMRGLASVSSALMVPNSVALLGLTFPPG